MIHDVDAKRFRYPSSTDVADNSGRMRRQTMTELIMLLARDDMNKILDVSGQYQCPNCPYNSTGPLGTQRFFLTLVCMYHILHIDTLIHQNDNFVEN